MSSGAVSGVLLVIITILLPPVGVFMIAGCGTDLFINIILTLCGSVALNPSPPPFLRLRPSRCSALTCATDNNFFPGHIHAFYLEYVYFDRRESSRLGTMTARRAPLVFSQNVQNGGAPTYGTVGGY